MKTNTKVLGAVMLVITICIVLSSCKSQGESESSETTDADNEIEDTSGARIPLTLVIKNLPSADAPVIVVVYGTKNKFPDPKDRLNRFEFNPGGDSLIAEITALRFGTYALVAYQDENSNGKIDKNFIGIPTEAYAFSNNYKPTVRAPKFGECKFKYSASNNTITMDMIQ